MKVHDADRSFTFYVTAEREHQAATPIAESTLTAWALLALVLVVLTIMIGG